MSAKINQGSDSGTSIHLMIGSGRFTEGKWYCECNLAARCLKTKKEGPNHGKWFWTCRKSNYDEQCSFFLWVEHEAAAKELLSASQLPPVPQTFTGADDEPHLPTVPGLERAPTFATITHSVQIAKRKRELGDAINHDHDGDDCNRNQDNNGRFAQSTMAMDDPFMHSRQPLELTRKAAKTYKLSTPAKNFIKRLESQTESLPTPNSRDYMSGDNETASRPRLRQSFEPSPTPNRFNDVTSRISGEDSDLATTILEMMRFENRELKASTVSRLRHVIGLRLDMDRAKIRRYEETISELRKQLDEMETTKSHTIT